MPPPPGAPRRLWRLNCGSPPTALRKPTSAPLPAAAPRGCAGPARCAERAVLVNPALWASPDFHFRLLASPDEGDGRGRDGGGGAALTLAPCTSLCAVREGHPTGGARGKAPPSVALGQWAQLPHPRLPQGHAVSHSIVIHLGAPPRCSHLPCFVMIISVWWRWNLSHRGRLHR